MGDWGTDKHNDKYLFRPEVHKFSEKLRINTNARQLSYWGLTKLVERATWRAGFVYQQFRLVIIVMH
jgi:hypothetical protein